MITIPILDYGIKKEQLEVSDSQIEETIALLKSKKDKTYNKNLSLEPGHTKREDLYLEETEYKEEPLSSLVNLILEKVQDSDNYELTLMHGQIQNPGQSCSYHYHCSDLDENRKKDLSFVFYLNKCDSDGVLRFPLSIYKKRTTLSFNGEKKDLILFPSWLPHYVTVNESDQDRILIAGNLRFNNN